MATSSSRSTLSSHPADRLVAAVGAAAAVALVGWLLVFGLVVSPPAATQSALALVELSPPPPPPPPRARPVEQVKRSPAKEKASPRNLRAKPTEIVAPPPIVVPPPKPPPVAVAPIRGTGAAAHAGASTLPGPGYGAGGNGNGPGGGGEGEGGDTPPEQIKGRLKFSDLPPDLRHPGFRARVGVRYRVNVDGRVSDCQITRSSGMPELDATTCSLIEQRFRFRPSRDPDGQPVRSGIEENHEWGIARDPDDGDDSDNPR